MDRFLVVWWDERKVPEITHSTNDLHEARMVAENKNNIMRLGELHVYEFKKPLDTPATSE